MADPNSPSAGRAGAIDRLKSGAAILGALAGAVTGLYGVYEKVRSEAKEYTAASYNTLAPQMNQIGEALKHLQQENQQLREIVAAHQGKPRIGATPPAAARKPAAGKARRPNTTAGAPAAPTTAAAPTETAPAAPGDQARAPAAPGNGSAPAGDDPIGGLLNTVGRTRAAIETLRKVPEDFEKVVGKKQEDRAQTNAK